MALAPGRRLGPYEILSPLGEGGMGEVYRARDTRLGREVAVKVLLQHLSSSPELRARFEREARTVSGLNHPHICVLHDVGREGDIDYLVMELLDGETLAARLSRSALSPAEAMRLGIQVADALERAHRAGVVHRDLKPGNVMLTRSGAKLMDFGLARSVGVGGPTGSSGITLAGFTHAPTSAEPLTSEGSLIGTFHYMAPEQLEGREADARTDVWGLGLLLYEMVSGRRAFEGSSQASLIGAIMRDEPRPLPGLAPVTPAALDRLVRTCLEKDPDERWQRAHDVRLALEAIQDASSSMTLPEPAAPPQRRRRVHPGLALVVGLVAGIGIGIGLVTGLRPAPVTELAQIRTITHSGEDQAPVCSPDGRTIAFSSSRSGVSRIWLKQLSTGNEVALTDGEDGLPRFSPDGSQLLFARIEGTQVSLWRVPMVGGSARRLVESATEGEWSPDGTRLAFLRSGFIADSLWSEVWVAGADASNPRRIHRAHTAMRWLTWSPDGRELLFGNVPRANGRIEFSIVSVANGSVRPVVPQAGLARTSNPVWLGEGDRIAYAVAESRATTITGQSSRVLVHSLRSDEVREVLAVPTTCDRIAILGTGALVLGTGQFAQSLLLVDDPGTAAARERWLTRGASVDRQPVFSRDGSRVLFSSNRAGNLDLWEVDLATDAITRVTDDPAQDWDPYYTPDGSGILWSSDRSGQFEIWAARSDGSAPRQLSRDGIDAENPSMTPDGKWIVYLSGRSDQTGFWKMRADGSEARNLVPGALTLPELSASGAFVSAVIGISAVTSGIRLYDPVDGKPFPVAIPGSNISTAGLSNGPNIALGRHRWIGDSRIAYVDADERGRVGVSVREVSADAAGPPQPLAGFDPGMPVESFGVTPDGSRIVLSVRSANQSLMLAENVPGIDPPVRAAAAR